MVQLCPFCGYLLYVQESADQVVRFTCKVCPFVYTVNHTIICRSYNKLKEVDDVLGGEEAWKNVDSTDAICPKCENTRAYFMQIQTRSADEPMTTFYRCCRYQCSHNWRE